MAKRPENASLSQNHQRSKPLPQAYQLKDRGGGEGGGLVSSNLPISHLYDQQQPKLINGDHFKPVQTSNRLNGYHHNSQYKSTTWSAVSHSQTPSSSNCLNETTNHAKENLFGSNGIAQDSFYRHEQTNQSTNPSPSSSFSSMNSFSPNINRGKAFPLLISHYEGNSQKDSDLQHEAINCSSSSTSPSPSSSSSISSNSSSVPPLSSSLPPSPEVSDEFIEISDDEGAGTSSTNEHAVLKRISSESDLPRIYETRDSCDRISEHSSSSESSISPLASALFTRQPHFHSYDNGQPCHRSEQEGCSLLQLPKTVLKFFKQQAPISSVTSNATIPSTKLAEELVASVTYVRLKQLSIDWDAVREQKQCCGHAWADRQTWNSEHYRELMNLKKLRLSPEEEKNHTQAMKYARLARVDINELKRKFGDEQLSVADHRLKTIIPEENTSMDEIIENRSHPQQQTSEATTSSSMHKAAKRYMSPIKSSTIQKAKRISNKSWYFEEYFYSEYREKAVSISIIIPISMDCPLCGLTFCIQQFANHLVTVHILDEMCATFGYLLCKHCFKKFDTQEELDDHYSIVNNITPLSCMICLLRFNTEEDRMAHMRRNHFRFTMPFQCDLCKYRSSTSLQFRNHFDRSHSEAYCPCCHMVFPSSLHLQSLTSQPFKDHVSVTMKFANEVRLHMIRHLAVKDIYSCDQCSLTFINGTDLAVHKKIGHVCYQKQPKLKGGKAWILAKFALNPIQQINLPFFRTESELLTALGPIIPTGDSQSAYTSGKRSKRVFPGISRSIGDDNNESQDSTSNSVVSLQEDQDVQNVDLLENQNFDDDSTADSATPVVDNTNQSCSEDNIFQIEEIVPPFDLHFFESTLGLLSVPKDDRQIRTQTVPCYCRECFHLVYEDGADAETAIALHYSLDKPLECKIGNCIFRTTCREAFRSHSHEFLYSDNRKIPCTLMDRSKVSENHKSHFSVCRNCGVRFLSIEEACIHLYNNPTHLGYSEKANESEDESEDEAEKVEKQKQQQAQEEEEKQKQKKLQEEQEQAKMLMENRQQIIPPPPAQMLPKIIRKRVRQRTKSTQQFDRNQFALSQEGDDKDEEMDTNSD